MKKTISIVVATLVLMSLIPSTAFGHGHRGRSVSVPNYSLCGADSCHTVTNHWHDTTYYYGHSYDDGHDYHTVCSVEGCEEIYSHLHDDIVFLPHANDVREYNGNGYQVRGGCH